MSQGRASIHVFFSIRVCSDEEVLSKNIKTKSTTKEQVNLIGQLKKMKNTAVEARVPDSRYWFFGKIKRPDHLRFRNGWGTYELPVPCTWYSVAQSEEEHTVGGARSLGIKFRYNYYDRLAGVRWSR